LREGAARDERHYNSDEGAAIEHIFTSINALWAGFSRDEMDAALERVQSNKADDEDD
jgi:hypothetical protein